MKTRVWALVALVSVFALGFLAGREELKFEIIHAVAEGFERAGTRQAPPPPEALPEIPGASEKAQQLMQQARKDLGY